MLKENMLKKPQRRRNMTNDESLQVPNNLLVHL